MLNIPPDMFHDALKQYRHDVPTVGTVSFDQAQAFLEEGRICRGWMQLDDNRKYFHIIKSPAEYPEKAMFSGENEKDLFRMTIMLGMESGIELEDLLNE